MWNLWVNYYYYRMSSILSFIIAIFLETCHLMFSIKKKQTIVYFARLKNMIRHIPLYRSLPNWHMNIEWQNFIHANDRQRFAPIFQANKNWRKKKKNGVKCRRSEIRWNMRKMSNNNLSTVNQAKFDNESQPYITNSYIIMIGNMTCLTLAAIILKL